MTSCHRRLTTRLTVPTGPVHSRLQTPPGILTLPFNRNSVNQRLRVIFTSQKHNKSFILKVAAESNGVWDRSDRGNESTGQCPFSVADQASAIADQASKGGNEAEKSGRFSYSAADEAAAIGGVAESRDKKVHINGIESRISSKASKNQKVEVAIAVAATVVLGVGNRVLYKLALVPLKHYPFFLAQIATFGYIIVYFTILAMRYEAGVVTKEMLSMPKAPYLLVGFLEALAAATGMAAAAILSGASIPILSQTFLVWQILLSIIFLGRRYKMNQLLGCFLVGVGVIITVASGSNAAGTSSVKGASIFWSVLMIFSFLLQAADTVLKEFIFLDAAKQLKGGGSVDLFVVNSYGSAFQALFVCLLLPFMSKLWGIPFSQLPSYIRDGAVCFLNIGNLSSGCEGAPLLPLLFVVVNMGYNISLLHLLKISSAVVSSLASTFSVPISVYVFTLPLPYLGVASSLPTGFVAGAIILIMGLFIYAWRPSSSTTASPSLT